MSRRGYVSGVEAQQDLLLVGLGRSKELIRAEYPRVAQRVGNPKTQLYLSGIVVKSIDFGTKWTPVAHGHDTKWPLV